MSMYYEIRIRWLEGKVAELQEQMERAFLEIEKLKSANNQEVRKDG